MLSIIFNRGEKDIDNPNYVFSPDTYFKYNYEEEQFDDELVQEMIQDVDASAIMSAHEDKYTIQCDASHPPYTDII